MSYAFDRVVEVIDRVKTDERTEDTDVYAAEIFRHVCDPDLALSFEPGAIISHFDGDPDVVEALDKLNRENPEGFRGLCYAALESSVLYELFCDLCNDIAREAQEAENA